MPSFRKSARRRAEKSWLSIPRVDRCLRKIGGRRKEKERPSGSPPIQVSRMASYSRYRSLAGSRRHSPEPCSSWNRDPTWCRSVRRGGGPFGGGGKGGSLGSSLPSEPSEVGWHSPPGSRLELHVGEESRIFGGAVGDDGRTLRDLEHGVRGICGDIMETGEGRRRFLLEEEQRDSPWKKHA